MGCVVLLMPPGMVQSVKEKVMQFSQWLQRHITKNGGQFAWVKDYMRQGTDGYRKILERLEKDISEEEAEIAYEAKQKGMKATIVFILVGVLLNVITYNLPPSYVDLSSFTYDLSWAFGLLASLVLVSYYRVSFGGRLMVMAMGLLAFYSPPVSSLRPDLYLFTLVLILAEAAFLGCCIDYGASTEPKRPHPRRRRWVLLLPGLIIPASVLFDWRAVGRFPVLTILAGFLCSVWGWWIVPRLEKQVNLGHDCELLRTAAMSRYTRFISARIFAVLAGALPFYLLLASFDIDQRLRWPEGNGPAMVTTIEGHQKIWFWQQKARLLRITDCNGKGLYGFHPTSLDLKTLDEINSEFIAIRKNDQDERAFLRLKGLLDEYSIDNADNFRELFSTDGIPVLFSLEENSVQGFGPFHRKKLFHIENLFHREGPTLVSYTKNEIQEAVSHNETWRYLLAFFGTLGFILIWKRGADYSVARWLGVWLIGAALAGAYRYSSLFLPAFYFQIWHRAVDLPSGQFILALLLLIQGTTWVIVMAFAFCIPCAAVWTYVCWPQTTRSEKTNRLTLILLAIKIALVAVAMNLTFFLSILTAKTIDQFTQHTTNIDIPGVLAIIVFFSSVSLSIGFLVQRRYDPKDLSALDWLSASFFIACQPIVLLATTQEITTEADALLRNLSLFMGVSFMVILLALFLTRQFLQIINAQQLSFAIVIILIPGLLTIMEDYLKDLVAFYSQSALIYSKGAKALSGIVAVALFPKIRLYVERALTFFTPYHTLKIESRIRKIMEELGDLRQPAALDRLRQTFEECGLADYGLYSRRDNDDFEIVIKSSNYDPPPKLAVSRFLRRFLGRNPRFIDLNLIALEWRFFFFQFELSRLQRATGSGYLLPVIISEGVRGILFIPYDPSVRHAIGDLSAREIGNLGLIAVHR
jgi:hypothetical protein